MGKKQLGISSTVVDTAETSSYTTSGEDLIAVETSNGPATVTLASADVEAGASVEIQNITGANDVTAETEGAETIDGASSTTISQSGWSLSFVSDGSDWHVNNNADFETVSASNELGNPTYATLADVPTNLPEGTQVYVEDENAVYVEDGI